MTAKRYVTPTRRPQWNTERLWRRLATIGLVSFVLPFVASASVVYVLLRMYFAAGGSW